MKPEEKLIINEIRKGNRSVYKSIFHKHYDILVSFANQFLCNHDSSKDVVQGVFIYLWENSHKLKIEKSLKSYLYQSVKNSCLNHLRSIKIKDKHRLLYLEALINTNDTDVLEDSCLVDDIESALNELPKEMYAIIVKKYFLEQSIKEIAQEMTLSENTVKVQLFNGRNKIRKIIELKSGCFFFF